MHATLFSTGETPQNTQHSLSLLASQSLMFIFFSRVGVGAIEQLRHPCTQVHGTRERWRLKILHSKSAMQEKNLHSKIIFCTAVCKFCIANLIYT